MHPVIIFVVVSPVEVEMIDVFNDLKSLKASEHLTDWLCHLPSLHVYRCDRTSKINDNNYRCTDQ